MTINANGSNCLSRNTFNDDVFSRRAIRFLLFLHMSALTSVLVFNSGVQGPLALGISILSLFIVVVALIWLYIRYQNLPVVREKSVLEERIARFQSSIQTEANIIAEATKKREELLRAEKHEIDTALSNVQDAYIEYGLGR